MFQSEFQVTLPSTSSIKYFPNNKPAVYQTMLKSPLFLEGDWEVALIDLQFPYNWKNFHEEYLAVLMRIVPEDMVDKFKEIEKANHLVNKSDAAGRAILNKAKEYAQQSNLQPTIYLILKIPGGYYKTPQNLIEVFTQLINHDPIKGSTPSQVQIEYDSLTNRNKLNVNRNHISWITIFSRKQNFFKSTGMPSNETPDKYFSCDASSLSFDRCEWDQLTTMYVYTDITKWQPVGDTEAPLLGVLPIKGNYGEQVYWSFNPPFYLPLSQSQISSVEIKLASDNGDDFPIELPGKVVARMHFRRKHFGL